MAPRPEVVRFGYSQDKLEVPAFQVKQGQSLLNLAHHIVNVWPPGGPGPSQATVEIDNVPCSPKALLDQLLCFLISLTTQERQCIVA